MTSIPSDTIELLGVSAVVAETLKPGSFLKPNIPVGDKAPSFDGEIGVYRGKPSISTLIKNVRVQVKGKTVKNFSKKSRSYSLKVDHYQNFYNHDGVILFVVEIKPSHETKIFYKQLLGLELKSIINECASTNKKEKAVKLRELSGTSIYEVCRKFIVESDKQPKNLIELKPQNLEKYDSFKLTSLTFDPKNTEDNNIFEHDFSLYGMHGDFEFPIQIVKPESIQQTIADSITIDEKKYECDLKITTNKDSDIEIIIDNSLRFTFNEQKKKLNFSLINFNSVATQLKIVPLLIDAIKCKEIYFSSYGIANFTKLEKSENFIGQLDSLNLLMNRLDKVFKLLNIDNNTQINMAGNSFGEFIIKAEQLTNAILDNNYDGINLPNTTQSSYTLFSFGDLNILLFFSPNQEKKLIDVFSNENNHYELVLSTSDGTKFKHSLYSLIGSSSLAKAVNINLSMIKSSFSGYNIYENDIAFDYSNNFCLNCICAYDISKNIELLDLAEFIYQKYYESNSDDNVIITTNLMQIKYRRDGLTTQEQQHLISIKIKDLENYELQFCVNVLLQNKADADFYLHKFTEERITYYKTLPIYTLYTNI
ncbi:DUF4365 domain-containing protein [Gottfriedia luciferensis]|uniref:DUF4365 domain-containing protein n=1 Tax=Gottfriedia luciferensis TaxID=178774 RepID=UPI000B45172D|nr:DUF4365 domain-containing protein [Gottfriedia luciferensis]